MALKSNIIGADGHGTKTARVGGGGALYTGVVPSYQVLGSYWCTTGSITGNAVGAPLFSLELPKNRDNFTVIKRIVVGCVVVSASATAGPFAILVHRVGPNSTPTGGLPINVIKQKLSDVWPRVVLRTSPTISVLGGILWKGFSSGIVTGTGPTELSPTEYVAIPGTTEDTDVILQAGESICVAVGNNHANFRFAVTCHWMAVEPWLTSG